MPSPDQPPVAASQGFEEVLELDAPLDGPVAGVRRRVFDRYEELDFGGALGELWTWVAQLNQRIVAVSPWQLAKDPARKPELDAFLYRLLEGVRLVAVVASPVIPRAASRIFHMLGLGDHEATSDDLTWGRLEPGTAIGAVESLFPRVETARAIEKRENDKRSAKSGQNSQSKEKTVTETKPPEANVATGSTAANAASEQRAASGAGFTPAERAGVQGGAAQPPLAQLDIADFAKVELRAAVIKEAEKIAGSKKLIKLLLDLGAETRQVVAGIAESYAPEALVGKRIVLVANLKPARLMGVESNGMVLAGSVDGKAVLCTFDGDVAPGTKVK